MVVGIIRKLDPLGRLTIPVEMRRHLKWDDEKAELSVAIQDGCLVVREVKDNVLSKSDIERRLSKKYSDEEIAEIIKELNLED